MESIGYGLQSQGLYGSVHILTLPSYYKPNQQRHVQPGRTKPTPAPAQPPGPLPTKPGRQWQQITTGQSVRGPGAATPQHP